MGPLVGPSESWELGFNVGVLVGLTVCSLVLVGEVVSGLSRFTEGENVGVLEGGGVVIGSMMSRISPAQVFGIWGRVGDTVGELVGAVDSVVDDVGDL